MRRIFWLQAFAIVFSGVALSCNVVNMWKHRPPTDSDVKSTFYFSINPTNGALSADPEGMLVREGRAIVYVEYQDEGSDKWKRSLPVKVNGRKYRVAIVHTMNK